MKVVAFVGFLLMGVYSEVAAQSNQYIRIKAGENLTGSLSFTDRYQYPQFTMGKLVYAANKSAAARFNYHLFLNEMQFINATGDTLALENDPTLQLVVIGPDSFYYEYPKTYWQLVGTYGSAQLLTKRTMVLIDREKEGGYQQSMGASSIRTTTTYSASNGPIARLDTHSDMVFSKKAAFRLRDTNGQFHPASQVGFLHLFAKNKGIVKQYLKEHSIKFNQENDLRTSLSFCKTLP
ncbi:hypothetical protein [Spirosoma radiotolerans]|uniref:Uncharacterized protein n=1 Tax=Spirosoma radiotolerans TaxID=1379870 RepID=A0A0E3V8W5_9BACT|nr:hypothetical protein [Spirosoma radiotolerans]AKD57142.1 hypothetical protein SD10_21830 [Spirosoma radiotolerans]